MSEGLIEVALEVLEDSDDPELIVEALAYLEALGVLYQARDGTGVTAARRLRAFRAPASRSRSAAVSAPRRASTSGCNGRHGRNRAFSFSRTRRFALSHSLSVSLGGWAGRRWT